MISNPLSERVLQILCHLCKSVAGVQNFWNSALFCCKTTEMGANDERKSCLKCHKAVKGTERVVVCGLWCKKSFHNCCVGLTNSETRVVACSNDRIKFHCEICENRLGTELGEKETHEPNNLQSTANNCLLELVQKILKLTTELSNDNSVINKKLDTVISSNTKLEEHLLPSPKCLEKRNEETSDNTVDCVEHFSARRTTAISENSNKTISDNQAVNSASVPQQSDNSSSLQVASSVPEQLSENQEPLVAEECNSNNNSLWSFSSLHELEVPGHRTNLQEPLNNNKEECIPSEDLLVGNVCSIPKTEYEEGEEKDEIEIDDEECLSSEDFHGCSTFSFEKIEHGVDEEAVGEDMLEELKHEVGSASSDKAPESNIIAGSEDNSSLTDVSHTSGKGDEFQHTTKPEVCCASRSRTRFVEHWCKICKNVFRNLRELKEHTNLNRCELQHLCNVCHKTFTCNVSLENHIQMHTREQQNVCDVCNKTLTCSSSLKEHIVVHTGKRPYRCCVCGKKFNFKNTLKSHWKLHSGKRSHSCSVCNKTFKNRMSLVRHSFLHSAERPFSCIVCNKTFKHKRNLTQHSYLHSDEHPHICTVCDKTFPHLTLLKQHLWVHSGERPYGCSVCSKTFIGLSKLRDHLLVHSGERPFSCSVCSKTFKWKKSLKQHSRVHSGECPFSCSVCNKTFKWKISLKQHSRVHSGVRSVTIDSTG